MATADAVPVANSSTTLYATQSTAQSVSAAAAQPVPLFTQAPAHTQAPLPASATADAARTLESGQLRVTPSSSELKISVQLPELGKVEVRAVTSHDVTTAHLTAFRHDALPALAAERTGLEQALKSRDVILGSFDSPGHSAGQQRQQSSHPSAHSLAALHRLPPRQQPPSPLKPPPPAFSRITPASAFTFKFKEKETI